MDLQKIKQIIQFDTAGWIALSSLLLCSLSGILLAIPYDFAHPHHSVFSMLMLNPAGAFTRNLHYWSAQLFFVFTLLHLFDHLSKSTETKIKSRRTWLILCLAVMFLGYEMISGFMLKGDAAGLQARRIVASMLESVPVFGRMLRSALAGSEDQWQIVYVHHIATGTIILFIAIFEHLKTLWPRLKTFVVVMVFLLFISWLFRAPLGQEESNLLKGPWFFVGIQEMLHWSSHPGTVLLIVLIVPLVLLVLPEVSTGKRSVTRKILLGFSVLYLALTLFVILFRGGNWELKSVPAGIPEEEQLLIFDPIKFQELKSGEFWPENRKSESCLLCHGKMEGLSVSHNPESTGCFACHLGDPFSADKQKSHKNMVKVPGDFENARQTCGTLNCHPEITARILNSLMTTQSGIIAVDKFVFGETKSLNDTFHVENLQHTAADTHLRNLCAGCHLGNEKKETGNAGWLERGGGCNACHLHYDGKAEASMKLMQSGAEGAYREVHPAIDIRVTNDRCRSCHSRSGRISLNYEGWCEKDVKDPANKTTDSLMVLPDERELRFVQADVHHQKGMACIDCHNSYEIMGDGNRHAHKEQAVQVQCVDCHPTGKANFTVLGGLPDRESQMVAWLRKYNPETRIIVTSNGAQPLLNTSVDSTGQIWLTDKLNSKLHLSRPASPVCSKGAGHKRLSCESCHTAWVPQCIGCHNSFEKETPGFDLLESRPTKGSWVEYAARSMAENPVLGVSDRKESRIVTTMPGMIMTIDHDSFEKGGGTSFHRLYAPASGHTTQRTARSCKSCHNSPLALGFGRGELHYQISGKTGKWSFEPMFELNSRDGLPEDAWTGFLKEASPPYATRDYLRPFNVREQQQILAAGSCLTCHGEKSKVADAMLTDFNTTIKRKKSQCILPSW
jgi:hypothetical protein